MPFLVASWRPPQATACRGCRRSSNGGATAEAAAAVAAAAAVCRQGGSL